MQVFNICQMFTSSWVNVSYCLTHTKRHYKSTVLMTCDFPKWHGTNYSGPKRSGMLACLQRLCSRVHHFSLSKNNDSHL